MSSSRSSPSPLKSKSNQSGMQSSTPKHKPSPATNAVISTPTPNNEQLPRSRLRNRHVALSVKEVRRIAQGTTTRNGGTHLKSARRQISSWPDESTITNTTPARQPNSSVDDGPTKIPAKYKMLGEFFDSLDSSIRLLRMKGSSSTFTNICPKIQCLTDRRFSYKHLAQLKYVLPEAIEITRVLMFDEQTSCMKPDLHVTVNVDAIECDGKLKSESNNIHLRKVFRARLVEFYKAHPEGDEIPEELLPEPFNRPKHDLRSDMAKTSSSSSLNETSAGMYNGHSSNSSLRMETEPIQKQPVVASHFSQSFRRHFSQKVTNVEVEDTNQISPKACHQESVSLVPQPHLNKISSTEETNCSAPPPNVMSCKPTDNQKSSAFLASSAGVTVPCLPATPSKEIDLTNNRDNSPTKIASSQSTPAKLASTPAKLMSSTPALHPPKRCYMSPDDDSTGLSDKLARRPLRSRTLKFDTPVKKNIDDKPNETGDIVVDDDISNILPESLLQSIREKERKVKEDQDPAISQAKRRRQMIACLPKLFNMIHFLFQSIKRSVITKDELMHKIISSHANVVDRREVEEQLSLLLELAPEWISEKLASSGDLLMCINKLSSPETIRARLEEAK